MKPILLCVLPCLFAITLPKGCMTSAAKSASKSATSSRTVVSKSASNAVKNKAFPHVPSARAVSSVALGIRAQVQRSKALGQKLATLKPRIPPQYYVRLYNNWQQNDAELNSTLSNVTQLEAQCTCNQSSCSKCNRRIQLVQYSQVLTERNVEIERLVSQYG